MRTRKSASAAPSFAAAAQQRLATAVSSGSRAFVVLLGLALCISPPAAAGADRVIVKWQTLSDPSPAGRAAAAERVAGALGVPPLQLIRTAGGGIDVFQVQGEAAAAAAQLSGVPEVAYAVPDRRLFPQAYPNDPHYGTYQWALHPSTEYPGAANVQDAWTVDTGSADVTVAVVDTGLVRHPDLSGRYHQRADGGPYGFDMVSADHLGDGSTVFLTANDGDGRDADPSDPGDWIDGTEGGPAPFANCAVSPSSWHGTHVAGIIAASADNAIGIAGVDWQARLLPVRVLGKCGGYLSDILDGIRWAAGLAVPGIPANRHPARVINLSLGALSRCGPAEQEAVDDALAAGAIVVAAAGNAGADVADFTPASCEGVIAVAATGPSGGLADYSNRGEMTALAAPGGDWPPNPGGIWSTVELGREGPIGSFGFQHKLGTSMAAPHVSGALALMLSANRTRTGQWLPPAVLRNYLLAAATRPEPLLTSCSGGCGAGLLDVAAAVRAVSEPPRLNVPANVVAGPGERVVVEAEATGPGGILSWRWRQLSPNAFPVTFAVRDGARVQLQMPEAPHGTQLELEVMALADTGIAATAVVPLTIDGGIPVFEAVATPRVAVGSAIDILVTAHLSDGGIPTLRLAAAPAGAELQDRGDGTARFTWLPPSVGRFPVTVVATNAGSALQQELQFDVDVVPAAVTSGHDDDGGNDGAFGGIGASGVLLWGVLAYVLRRRARGASIRPPTKP